MPSKRSSLLQRYRVPLLTMGVLALIGLQPVLLAPWGGAYILLCERLLNSMPVGHHFPPLLVALIVPILGAAMVGGLVAAGREAIKQRQLADALRARRWWPGEEERGSRGRLGDTPDVLVTRDEAVFAFCGGLIRPRIYLSRGVLALLDEDEVDALISHERHHMRRRDPLRFFLTGLLRSLAPVIPVFESLDQLVRVKAELAADRAALASQPPEVLASTLVKVMRAASTPDGAPAVAGISPSEARIAVLLGKPVTVTINRADAMLSLLLLIEFSALAVWLALQPLPHPLPCSVCPGF